MSDARTAVAADEPDDRGVARVQQIMSASTSTGTGKGLRASQGAMDAATEAAAEATEQHSIEFGRTDANGNNPCTCDQWWDTDQGPGWDEHMAEIAYAAMEPLIRKAVAEEIARRIWQFMAENPTSTAGAAGMRIAAEIAREAGA